MYFFRYVQFENIKRNEKEIMQIVLGLRRHLLHSHQGKLVKSRTFANLGRYSLLLCHISMFEYK